MITGNKGDERTFLLMYRLRLIQLRLLLILSFSVIFCDSLKYAPVRNESTICFPKDSCSVARDEDSTVQHNCDCSRTCSLYRTCCIDSPFLNHSTLYRRRSCRTIGQNGMNVFVVDTCSRHFEGPGEIRRRCEDEIIDWSDPVANAPVTNPDTQTTYKSLFCAICNMEKPHDLTIWNVVLDCTELGEFMHVCTKNRDFVLDNIMYVKEKQQWGLWSWDKKSDWNFRFLAISYTLPNNLKTAIKECRPNLVPDCPPNFSHEETKRLCKLYMGAVYFPHIAFRNIHCALCNRVKNFTEMSCQPYDDSSFRSPSLSFGLLLDIDLSDGNTVGVIDKCANGQVYDPFAKKCRDIECPIPGYTLKNNQCVKE